MIEIKIPKEIQDYKEKFMFGLTIRQFVSVAAALAICVPLYVFGKDALGADLMSWIIIIIAAPLFAFGFFKYNGMPFEQFLIILWRQKWAEPQKRKYIELPVYWYCREEIIADELAHQQEEIKRNKRKDGKNGNANQENDGQFGEER